MSAPLLGPSELGGAFCLYQRTQVLFPFRRRGRKEWPGPPFPLPSLSRRDLTIKGLRSLLRLRLQARSLGQINTVRRGSKARGRGLPHPFPPSLGEPGSSHWFLNPDRPWEGFRGGLHRRRDGDPGVRLDAERERPRRIRGCGTSFQAPDLAQGSASSKTKFLRGGAKRLDSPC